jgi:hypothetical protein
MSWTLEEALHLIRLIQPKVMRDANYYLALAGGVLNNGSSENDLDLVAVPRMPGAKRDDLQRVLAFFDWKLTGGGMIEAGGRTLTHMMYDVFGKKVELTVT